MRILITGGNSWIALALAADRIARGDEVSLTASSEASLDALLAACRDRGLTASCFIFDLGRPDRRSAELDEHLAGIGGLVLNAATPVSRRDLFHKVPQSEVDASIDADIRGNLFVLRKALPIMLERRFGRIVFVSSVSVVMGTSRYGAYCLTKSALEGLMLNLAVDYGDRNVLSNTVRLGMFRTRRTGEYWSREKYTARAASLIPQGTLGDPGALPEAIHPLLSPTQYMNGCVVTVSGGLPLMKASSLSGRADP
jgi:3-oxoacyl-[acyl-carrier protein] reductase